MEIEFVSYTGKYPNLCSGILTLLINGIPVTFGADVSCDYYSFWYSGGRCWLDDEWREHVDHDEWRIHEEDLPDCLRPYAKEIIELFNDNVDCGCCGGCI